MFPVSGSSLRARTDFFQVLIAVALKRLSALSFVMMGVLKARSDAKTWKLNGQHTNGSHDERITIPMAAKGASLFCHAGWLGSGRFFFSFSGRSGRQPRLGRFWSGLA